MLQTCFSFSVVLSLATLSADDMNQTKPRVETRMLENSKWETKEVPVFFPRKTKPILAKVNSSVFVLKHKLKRFDPVKVIESKFEIWILQLPERKLTWVGGPQDYLIVSADSVTGFRLSVGYGAAFQWSDSAY